MSPNTQETKLIVKKIKEELERKLRK